MRGLLITFLLYCMLLVGCVSPAPAQAHIDKGIDYHVAGQYDQALAEYTTALDLDTRPEVKAHALSLRSATFLKMKDYEHALQDANASIELDPTVALTFMGRGYVYLELGQWEEAVTNFNKAIELDDQEYLAYLGRATAHVELKHPNIALADYKATIALAPNQPDAEKINAAIAELENSLGQ
jgi:tetratricopeptide (TPR) repeat protein